MKKIIAVVMLCGLVSNSCDADSIESAGLLAGGVGIGVVISIAGQFAYNKITGKNKKCTAAKNTLANLKTKYEDENVELSLESVKADLQTLDEVCAAEYLAEECSTDKEGLYKLLKNKQAELIDLGHIANRKKSANDLVRQLKQRYEIAIDLAEQQGKIRKDQFVRFALENYGGTNPTPLSTCHDNMNLDVQSLIATCFDDLSPENQSIFQTLERIVPAAYKYFGAECHEEIQKEQTDLRSAQYEKQMSEQEYQLKKKKIEAKDKEVQYLANLDKRTEQFVRVNENNINLILSRLTEIREQNNRLEDQHGGITRQNKNTKIAVDETRNIVEELVKNVNARFDEWARWTNEYNAWLHANSIQNNQQINNQHNYQASQASAPFQGQ